MVIAGWGVKCYLNGAGTSGGATAEDTGGTPSKETDGQEKGGADKEQSGSDEKKGDDVVKMIALVPPPTVDRSRFAPTQWKHATPEETVAFIF